MLHKIITAFLILIPLTYLLILTNPAPMPNQVTLPTATTLEEESTEPQGFAHLSMEEQKRVQNFMGKSSPKPVPLGQQEVINLIALSLLPFVYFFGIKYIPEAESKQKKKEDDKNNKKSNQEKKSPQKTKRKATIKRTKNKIKKTKKKKG